MLQRIMKFNVKLINEKIYVYVPEDYAIEERTVSDKMKNEFPEVDWLGDFIFKQNGEKIKGELAYSYEIRVEKTTREDGKALVFYDGSQVLEFTSEDHDLREITSGEYVYQRAKLDITDPPVGWR